MSEGPCNVSLLLEVNGVMQTYLLGTFRERKIEGWDSLLAAFDQSTVIVAIVLCGVLGWGNAPNSSMLMRSVAILFALLLIAPQTGVFLTNYGYDIRNFEQLEDPVFGISVNQVAFVIAYTMMFLLLFMHLTNCVISLPVEPLKKFSERFFFHQKRESAQIAYVKALFNEFRWAYTTQKHFESTRVTVLPFSYVNEAKMMLSGIKDNKDAFFFPLRLQVSLLLSTAAIVPILLGLLQFIVTLRTLVLQTVVPFFRIIFAAIEQFDVQNQIFDRPPLSHTSSAAIFAFSSFSQISHWAETLIHAMQTSAYIGIAFGLLRFVTGQFSLLLVARSNLLAARKGAFKIDSEISDYNAFFFVGNQIACSILGFVLITFIVAVVCFALMFETLRSSAFAAALNALPVVVLAFVAAVMKYVFALKMRFPDRICVA